MWLVSQEHQGHAEGDGGSFQSRLPNPADDCCLCPLLLEKAHLEAFSFRMKSAWE